MDLAISDLSEPEQKHSSTRSRSERRCKRAVLQRGSETAPFDDCSSQRFAETKAITRPSILKGQQTESFVNAPELVGTSNSPRVIRFDSTVRVINDGSISPLKDGVVSYTGEWLRAERVEKRLEQVLSKRPSHISPQDIYDVVYAQSESMLSSVRIYDAAGPPVHHPNTAPSSRFVICRDTREENNSAEQIANTYCRAPMEIHSQQSVVLAHERQTSPSSAGKFDESSGKGWGILCCLRRRSRMEKNDFKNSIRDCNDKCRQWTSLDSTTSEVTRASDEEESFEHKQTDPVMLGSPSVRRSAGIGLAPDFACEPIAAHLHIERLRLLAMDLIKYRAGNVFHETSLVLICRLLLPHQEAEIRADQPVRPEWLRDIGCSQTDSSSLLATYSMLAVLLCLQYISTHSAMAQKLLRADQAPILTSSGRLTDENGSSHSPATTASKEREDWEQNESTPNTASFSIVKASECPDQANRGRFFFMDLCLRTATALIHLLRYGRLNAICNCTDRVRLALELVHAGWLADFWKRWERGRISDVEAHVLATQRKIADGIGILAMIRAGLRTQDQSGSSLFD